MGRHKESGGEKELGRSGNAGRHYLPTNVLPANDRNDVHHRHFPRSYGPSLSSTNFTQIRPSRLRSASFSVQRPFPVSSTSNMNLSPMRDTSHTT
jgi:hypothetical protein